MSDNPFSLSVIWSEAWNMLPAGWQATVHDAVKGTGLYRTPRFSKRELAEERAKEWMKDHKHEV